MIDLLSVNRVAFTIGNTDIYWYGIIICLAIIAAIVVSTIFCKIKKYDSDMPLNLALAIIPVGILSARLFSVIFEDGLTLKDYLNFRTGGMSIIGAIIGGVLALVIYILIKKPKDKWIYFDTVAVVLILAQGIGRWGNYFNSEVYGQVVSPGSIFATFPFVVNIDGVYYQALFFYESALDLIGFLILSLVYLCSDKKGLPTAIYLIYYGTVRTILEGLRQEEYVLRLAGLPISRICSAIMIIAGIVLLSIILIQSRKTKVVYEKERRNKS